MIDIHIHTTHSDDAVSTMEEYVQRAIELGYEKIGFSEHIDYDYISYGLKDHTTDLQAYAESIKSMREKYGDKIKILFGAEFGYGELAVQKYVELRKQYDFDYVINSIHLYKGEDLWFPPFYEKRTKVQAYRDYLSAISDSLDVPYEFNVIAHVGYVLRKAIYEEKSLTVGEFGAELDVIFNKIIKRGVCLEINTNTRGAGRILPTEEMIRHYVELGGTKFSFGSDSHSVDRLDDGMQYVCDLLKSLGIQQTYHFEKGIELATPL